MTDVITKRTSTPLAKRVTKPLAKRVSTPLIATACAHEVHELCHLTSCECGCHGDHG
jgi:hypothetical protein